MRLVLASLWVVLLVVSLFEPARAQVGERLFEPELAQVGERPNDRPLDPVDLFDDVETRRLELPPVHPPGSPRTSAGVQFIVSRFTFQGSTVFSADVLAAACKDWLGTPIGSEDLEDIADAVTRLYLEAGYVSSGALVPDQDTEYGTLLLLIVEGRVSQINVTGTRRFRDSFIRKRLLSATATPVNIYTVERTLQLLQQDPQIKRIDARLTPGIRRGESVLSVEVEEASSTSLVARYSNHQSPTVGADIGEILLSQRNLLGIGDLLSADGSVTAGYLAYDFGYSLPLNRRDSKLRLGYRHSRSEVIEDPFDVLNLESELTTYSIALNHPVYRTPNVLLSLNLAYEYRRSKTTFLDGQPFFDIPGANANGRVEISVLRLSSDWVWRTRRQVMAIRSTANVGLGASNKVPSGEPDAKFFSFLGQAQWIYQLSDRFFDSQLVMRTDVQLASDVLVSMERFAVGGNRSVRGYRENQYVRDNGSVSSLELRVPLRLGLPEANALELAPFFDFGTSWNHRGQPSTRTIASLGVGLRYAMSRYLSAEAYWGGRLIDAKRSASGPQGHGFQMQITGRLP